MHASRWDTSLVERAIYYVLRWDGKLRTLPEIRREEFNAEFAAKRKPRAQPLRLHSRQAGMAVPQERLKR